MFRYLTPLVLTALVGCLPLQADKADSFTPPPPILRPAQAPPLPSGLPPGALLCYRMANGSVIIDVALASPWDLQLWLQQHPGWFVVAGPVVYVPAP